jgi:hypothetical protein
VQRPRIDDLVAGRARDYKLGAGELLLNLPPPPIGDAIAFKRLVSATVSSPRRCNSGPILIRRLREPQGLGLGSQPTVDSAEEV